MGTRFIATDENDRHPNYVQRILDAGEGDDTTYPGTYSPVRGLRTAALKTLEAKIAAGEDTLDISQWKAEVFHRAQAEGDVETGLVPAGQVASGIGSRVRVAEFIPSMAREAAEVLQRLAAAVTRVGGSVESDASEPLAHVSRPAIRDL